MQQSLLLQTVHTNPPAAGFLSIDDLANDQGELAVTLEYNSSNQQVYIEACTQLLTNTMHKDLAAAYLSLCTEDSPALATSQNLTMIPCAPASHCNKTWHTYSALVLTPCLLYLQENNTNP
jgi:hypothetical protein